MPNNFNSRDWLEVDGERYEVFRLDRVDGSARLPYSLKVLLESLLRNEDGTIVTAGQVRAVADWDPHAENGAEIQYTPARVSLQDFTGVPCVVDPVAMRNARCDGVIRRRPAEDQPADPIGARHRPLGHRRRFRQQERVPDQRRPRVPAQWRALSAVALGTRVFDADDNWRGLEIPSGDIFAWDEMSTYVRRAPYFEGMPRDPEPLREISGARVLALLGDSVTTDHISPAGAIKRDSPAGRYLTERGVAFTDSNFYGSRRGNHEVMIWSTFANIRLRNQLIPSVEGGFTRHCPSGEEISIFDASTAYAVDGAPLIVIAGSEYGSGSSPDWAAKELCCWASRRCSRTRLNEFTARRSERYAQSRDGDDRA